MIDYDVDRMERMIWLESLNWSDYKTYKDNKFTEKEIEMMKDKVNWNWNWIWRSQELSEEFIEKHIDVANWSFISMYQNLSEEFIEKYRENIDWFFFRKNEVIPEKTKKKYNSVVRSDLYHGILDR